MKLGRETETIEYKKSTGELKEGIISIAAILNKHNGGELYFGVRNDGTAAGQDISDKTLRDVSQAVYNHIEPQIFPDISNVVIDDKDCIRVVFEGGNVPYYAYGRAYLRVADEETWRLETSDKCCFVKLDYSPHKKIYKRSFCVIDHISSHGIDAVNRIIPNANGELFTCFDSAVLGVFEWINGENIQNEQTKLMEYKILGKVYAVPTDSVAIPCDKFSTVSADLFYDQWNKLRRTCDKNILPVLEQHSRRLKEHAARLALFADRCKHDTSHFYITHGDAGGNVIVANEKFYIVDWDDVRLAPPERDAWFCLHWEWAMTAFNDALRENGINYTLRPERLAYYCYDMFFFYLNAYMETYFTLGGDGIADKLTEYFNCWIEENIQYANNIK